jgi:hypothetical protein
MLPLTVWLAFSSGSLFALPRTSSTLSLRPNQPALPNHN